MKTVKAIQFVSWVVVAAALEVLAQAMWIPAKASVAQVLLHAAWTSTVESGKPHKPWPWADHVPVARLRVPSHQVDQIVLGGDSGAVLAFGPGESQSAKGLQGGARVIAGHRDTHFRFLKHLMVGQELILQNPHSAQHYRVTEKRVVDARTTSLDAQALGGALVLVTCYPFDAVQSGGSQRLVVFADRVDSV